MPLYQVNFEKAEAQHIEAVPYASEGVRERQDLQRLIARNLYFLGEELFLVRESFKEWEGSLREVDILAIDRAANLVVIELKRTDGGEYADLQAVRYAAMLSSLDFADVANIYARAAGKRIDEATQELRDFLQADTETPLISDRPRIVLVAPSFAKEIAMTCLWLLNAGIDIRCIKASLYTIGGIHHIDMEQELPQPTAAQYQYRLRDKQKLREAATVEQQQRKRSERVLPALEKRGLLKPGTLLRMRPYQDYLVSVPEDKQTAIFHDRTHNGIEWQGNRWNLSTLSTHIFKAYAHTALKLNPTEMWEIEGDSLSLAARAAELAVTAGTTLDSLTDDPAEGGGAGG